jgi:ligand-binding sensor domain-containing protein
MKKIFSIIFIFFVVVNLSAQSWYTYTTVNTNGKLPDNNVECLATDANGVLWIGTYFNGLVKFDGTNWTNYNTSNSPLKDKTIIDVAVDKQNNIWVANYANGVFRFNPSTNTWTQFTKESGALTNNYTYAIEVDNQGNIWVGLTPSSYNDPGVLRYNGSSWAQGNVFKDNFNSYGAEAIGVDKNGNVWCGTRIGLYKFDGVNWSVFGKDNTQGGLGGNYLRTIAGDALGNVWVGTTDYVNNQTVGGGLSKYNGSTWTIYKSSTHPIDDFVSAIAFRNNDVWIGTGFCGQFGNYKGVYVFNGSTFTHYQSQTTFPGNCVNDIVVDKNNNVWIGSAFGLTKYGTVVSVKTENLIPTEFSLDQNYPNPFNPSTVISYQLPTTAFVRLRVFDILGNEVASFVNKEQHAGYYNVTFNASKLTSGIYFYRLEAGTFSETKKLMLVK